MFKGDSDCLLEAYSEWKSGSQVVFVEYSLTAY